MFTECFFFFYLEALLRCRFIATVAGRFDFRYGTGVFKEKCRFWRGKRCRPLVLRFEVMH